jgi:hypothetical protein
LVDRHAASALQIITRARSRWFPPTWLEQELLFAMSKYFGPRARGHPPLSWSLVEGILGSRREHSI